jgi:hypothetical protein
VTRPWIAIVCLSLAACDGKSPPSPPIVDTPGTVETVNGSERIGWDQRASDTVELATISYAAYVDGSRVTLAGVACASTAATAGFPCTAPLPAMMPGTHTLELASFVNDGGVLESARSAALRVNVVAQTTAARVNDTSLAARSGDLTGGFDSPTDLAFAPDGRMFVAERSGRIRVVPSSPAASARHAGQVDTAIALADTLGARVQLLALALDPQFDRTHNLFAIYAAPSRSGDLSFTLARFREAGDTLGDRAVLLDGVPASRSPAAALRFGPDGKLYAAFDDGGEAERRQDSASMNGKVLRLESDGTTPKDASGGTPVYAAGYGSPLALDWDPPTGTLWVADRSAGASPFAFYRGTRVPAWSGRLLGPDLFVAPPLRAGVTVIASGPGGAIYYGTAGVVGRLFPDRAP